MEASESLLRNRQISGDYLAHAHLPGLVCLDLCAITQALSVTLEYTVATGPIANVRAQHFEGAVQNAIDKSDWRPPDPAHALIGQTLRKSGKALTDLDAVGSDQSTLLLVSCKSKIKTKRYDVGTYRVIRNTVSALTQAQQEWADVVESIRKEPVGDNYDFSGFARIVGVVCTPSVFYGPVSLFGPISQGVVAIMSFAEFQDWLAGCGVE